MKVQHVHELEVYAFSLQQEIFAHSRLWPKEETYSLIDQIRRASRSIGANLSEAWAKRRYPAHFLSKLTDSDGELAETRHWLRTAGASGYIDHATSAALGVLADKAGRQLGSMLQKYEQFCPPPRTCNPDEAL